MKEGHQGRAESFQRLDSVRSRLHNLRLRLEDRAAFLLGQHTHDFAHAPTWRAEDLETVYAGDQHGYAIVPDHADALGITIEGLKFEASEVDALELFGRIHGNW